jgi:predicted nuclease of restriction endonuclease-like RecB superfamily
MNWFRQPSKYKNTKTRIDGITFDSKAEAEFYCELKFRLKTIGKNSIQNLILQPKVYLTQAKILYKPDFRYEENGEVIYVDVKGYETDVFKIKKRLWKHYGVGTLRIIKKIKGNFETTEEVVRV